MPRSLATGRTVLSPRSLSRTASSLNSRVKRLLTRLIPLVIVPFYIWVSTMQGTYKYHERLGMIGVTVLLHCKPAVDPPNLHPYADIDVGVYSCGTPSEYSSLIRDINDCKADSSSTDWAARRMTRKPASAKRRSISRSFCG